MSTIRPTFFNGGVNDVNHRSVGKNGHCIPLATYDRLAEWNREVAFWHFT